MNYDSTLILHARLQELRAFITLYHGLQARLADKPVEYIDTHDYTHMLRTKAQINELKRQMGITRKLGETA